MNGPEHYAEAERLLGILAAPDGVIGLASARMDTATAFLDLVAQQAQVHATLALAAATIEASDTGALALWNGRDTREPVQPHLAWRKLTEPST